jgi:phospholipase A-2-activating protein
MSGSIDKSAKLFILNNATGKYEFENEFMHHNDFVYSICPSVTGDGFFTGGKDGKAYKVDLKGNKLQTFTGHTGAVNSISQALPDEVVTGSWDGTARIWNVKTGACIKVLPDHSHATSVLTLQNEVTITGS